MTHNISGYVAPGFEAVQDAFEHNFSDLPAGSERSASDLQELGAGFAAYIGDELVVNLTGGWKDRRKTQAWTADTLVPIYSTTKPIAALTACMEIFEHLDDPYEVRVAEVWPEFAAHGKENVTIGEMLSHQAGLPGFVSEIDPDLWFDSHALAAALADQPPMWALGTGSGYHPLTWGYLIAELVWRVSGKTLGTQLKNKITNADGADPNREIIDFWIGTPQSEHERVSEIIRPTKAPDLGELNEFRKTAFLTKWASPNRGGSEWRTMEIPSANGHGTAKAVARLYSAFANEGRIGNNNIINADGQFEAFSKRRSLGQDRILPYEIEFAAGVMRNNNRIYGPNIDTLGHAGWGGSMGLGDPDRHLSAAYVMNRQSNQLQTDERSQRLISALYSCL
ncbi:serine hydrolase domain-containing protein [Hirschia litorea]|uniref:Serine hydrolase domain-containing protein n=1 Tax=Hirschia litorea TaxID=1199156 RepID=A0ABW2IM95_9PROT